MAGGKETPRQKMVGMMYLVLTALLALNVSKSILQAFVSVNDGLSATNINFTDKNESMYAAFEAENAKNPQKVGFYWEKAQKVKDKSQEVVNFIEQIKGHIIAKTEAKTIEEVLGKDDKGNDTAISLHHVNSLDNYDVPAFEMGVAEPHAAKEMEHGFDAITLEKTLHEYRDFLVEQLKSKEGKLANEQLANVIGKTFELPEQENHGQVMSWSASNFYHAPLAACVTILSKLQADVKNAETDVIKDLFSQISANDFKFNTIEAKIISPSTYLLQGDTFKADVFLAAYDNTQNPKVEAVLAPEGSESGKPIQAKVGGGKGEFVMAAKDVGRFNLKGKITFKSPDGTDKTYPFEQPFQVAQPSLVVSPTAMNVFYRGLDNPVEVSVPGVAQDQVVARMSNGSIKPKGKGSYVVKPGKGRESVVTLFAKIDGKEVKMGQKKFRVKSVPDPKPNFAGFGPADATADIRKVKASQGMSAKMENFEFDLKFNITKFNLTMVVGGKPITQPSNGKRLSGKQKEMLARAKKGDKIFFEGIKAKGPDGTTRSLGALSFKLK